ncbi:Hypothetical predicted protein [Podarcis lilfordi]|uniref:Uncharacterized protein n=1 Tax=Podarcis lilfordi TaxID=74358 RepID=A0AA35KBX7_9SAUR|nr:Hypothetical predicted protein [Podarcis lilfordi]
MDTKNDTIYIVCLPDSIVILSCSAISENLTDYGQEAQVTEEVSKMPENIIPVGWKTQHLKAAEEQSGLPLKAKEEWE